MYKRGMIILLLMISVSACGDGSIFKSDSGVDPKNNNVVTIEDFVKQGNTELLTPTILARGNGNFYTWLEVYPNQIPLATERCNNISNWNLFLGDALDTETKFEFLITAKVASGWSNEMKDIPLIYVDVTRESGVSCKVTAFKGRLTSDVVVSGGGVKIDLTVNVLVNRKSDVRTFNRVLEVANKIFSIIPNAEHVVAATSSNPINEIARIGDSAVSSMFTRRAEETISETIKTSAAIGDQSSDMIVFHLDALGNDFARALIKVKLGYKESVFASATTSNGVRYLTYDTNIDRILGIKNADGKSIHDLLVEGKGGLNITNMRDAVTKEKMENVCEKLKQIFTEYVVLSDDDAIIARFAAIKKYTNYDADSGVRSKKCFSVEEKENLATWSDGMFAFEPKQEEVYEEVEEKIEALRKIIRLKKMEGLDKSAGDVINVSELELEVSQPEFVGNLYEAGLYVNEVQDYDEKEGYCQSPVGIADRQTDSIDDDSEPGINVRKVNKPCMMFFKIARAIKCLARPRNENSKNIAALIVVDKEIMRYEKLEKNKMMIVKDHVGEDQYVFPIHSSFDKNHQKIVDINIIHPYDINFGSENIEKRWMDFDDNSVENKENIFCYNAAKKLKEYWTFLKSTSETHIKEEDGKTIVGVQSQ